MQEPNNQQSTENDPIVEIFNSLPQVIKEAIVNSHWEQKIRAISKKNNLVIGDANTLEKNTFLVMLGIISPIKYADVLKQEIKLEDEKLNSIINSVEDEVFRDIKQKLVELQEKKQSVSILPEDNIKTSTPTKESIAAEMSDHLEILSDEPTTTLVKNIETAPAKTEVTSIENKIAEQKLTSVVESKTENYVVKPKVIDPYREVLE